MNFNLMVRIKKQFGTQKNFAKAVDESTYIVCRVVRGKTRLQNERLIKWAEVLNCSPDKISNI